jgi:hypothetical protein
MAIVVNWGKLAPVAAVEELDAILDTVHRHSDPQRPVIAFLEFPHNCRVDIGLGAPESIVIIWPAWPQPDADTYYVTVNPARPEGTKWFWLHGAADTEFERRHLIPLESARRVVREFFRTGARPDDVEWEEEHY